jgi:hypothetical protein
VNLAQTNFDNNIESYSCTLYVRFLSCLRSFHLTLFPIALEKITAYKQRDSKFLLVFLCHIHASALRLTVNSGALGLTLLIFRMWRQYTCISGFYSNTESHLHCVKALRLLLCMALRVTVREVATETSLLRNDQN